MIPFQKSWFFEFILQRLFLRNHVFTREIQCFLEIQGSNNKHISENGSSKKEAKKCQKKDATITENRSKIYPQNSPKNVQKYVRKSIRKITQKNVEKWRKKGDENEEKSMGKGGKGGSRMEPSSRKTRILQIGKVQGRVHPKLKHVPPNANTLCGCLRPAGEFVEGFFVILTSFFWSLFGVVFF